MSFVLFLKNLALGLIDSCRAILGTAGFASLALAAAPPPKVIDAWSYYDTPPFTAQKEGEIGLNQRLVDYLNRHLEGRYTVKLRVIPRARVALMLESGQPGMVLFAPSVIFGGVHGKRFLWSRPLLFDRQLLVSRPDNPIEYTGPGSLNGKVLGGMLGHVYPAIQSDIDTGKIRVERLVSESSLIAMLKAKRVDAFTISEVMLQPLLQETPGHAISLHYSRKDFGAFTRNLLYQKGMEELRRDIDAVILAMPSDPNWTAALSTYGLRPFDESKCQPAQEAPEALPHCQSP